MNFRPEVHVYGAPHVTRVVWRDGETEIDLTGCKVIEVERRVVMGEVPLTKITLLALFIEHDAEDAA